MITFLANKYTKWYFSIIKTAQDRATSRNAARLILGNVEGHHIYPKSIVANNQLVYLSIKEHFVCHWLLTKMLTGQAQYKMFHAMTFMSRKRTLSNFEIKICLTFKHKPCSDNRKANISAARKLTPRKICEHCNKSSDPGNFKKYHGDNCKENPNVDKLIWLKYSNTGKQQILLAKQQGNYKPPTKPTGEFTCPHCGKTGTNYGNMRLHHFDRCFAVTGKKHQPGYLPKCSCVACKREMDMANFGKHHCSSAK